MEYSWEAYHLCVIATCVPTSRVQDCFPMTALELSALEFLSYLLKPSTSIASRYKLRAHLSREYSIPYLILERNRSASKEDEVDPSKVYPE